MWVNYGESYNKGDEVQKGQGYGKDQQQQGYYQYPNTYHGEGRGYQGEMGQPRLAQQDYHYEEEYQKGYTNQWGRQYEWGEGIAAKGVMRKEQGAGDKGQEGMKKEYRGKQEWEWGNIEEDRNKYQDPQYWAQSQKHWCPTEEEQERNREGEKKINREYRT